MLKIILFALLAWFLYKLVFRVIIPVYKTTKQVKNQFSEMRAKMEEHQRQQEGYSNPPPPPKQAVKKRANDYIDFEEIK